MYNNNLLWLINNISFSRDLKKQFVHHLHDMKFLQSSDPRAPSSNMNSNNESLVKAIICAGLYPNVAYLQYVYKIRFNSFSTVQSLLAIFFFSPVSKSRQIQGRNVKKMSTPQDGRVSMHPKSVNDKESYFPSPFFVYHLKLKSTNNINLHDTTMVYPLPLLFFGESLKFYVEGGKEKVAIGKDIHVRCKKSIASIVMVSTLQFI